MAANVQPAADGASEPPALSGSTAVVVPELTLDKNWREIGDFAVWRVTSAKVGNGADLLRDGLDSTHWQSDGTQPHLISIQFQKKVPISLVAVYLDFKLDESYTPNRMALRAGSCYADLVELRNVDLEEPSGWVMLPTPTPSVNDDGCLKAHLVQLAVLSNHQNGRDTHVRQVRVFGPRPGPAAALGWPIEPTTVEFSQYLTVR